MRSTLAVFVAGAGLLLAASFPLAAHHSFAAEFDATKAVTLQGTVTKLDWMNPHIWIYLDTKDDSGTVAHWQCEGGPPNTLTRNGWSQGFAEDRRPGHHRGLSLQGRHQHLQCPIGEAAQRQERVCGFGRRRRAQARRAIALRAATESATDDQSYRRSSCVFHFSTAALTVASFAPRSLSGQAAGFSRRINSKPALQRRRSGAANSGRQAGFQRSVAAPLRPRHDQDQPGQSQMGTPELPFTEAGLKAWKSLRRRQWRLHRQLPALRLDALHELARSDPDHAEAPSTSRCSTSRTPGFTSSPSTRQHHEGATPTWFGDSVGHWDGDTFVVDTVNFNGRTRLDTIGHPHSDALHVIERFTRTDANAHRLRSDHRRSQDFHQALDQQANLHAAARLGNHGVLVRREQQGSLRRPHQGAAAA